MKEHNIRLIDANALYSRYKHFGLRNGTSIGRHSGVAEEILYGIQNAPTIDLESLRPVGKWKHRNNWDKFVCTACSFEADAPTPYCPYCGTRMEE